MKRIVSFVMATAMVFASFAMVFAATGDGVITVTNPKEGETYKFYKVLDLDYVKTVYAATDPEVVAGTKKAGDTKTETYGYTINSDFQAFFDQNVKYDHDGNASTPEVTLASQSKNATATQAVDYIKAQDTAGLMPELTVALNAYVKSNRIAAAESVAAAATGDTKIEDAEFGYYLMVPSNTDGTGSAIFSLDSVTPEVSITNKSTYPGVDEKTVTDADETNVTSNTASVGDVLDFTVKSKVPDMAGYTVYTFKISDTVEHMTFVANSAVLKINGVDVLKYSDAAGADNSVYTANVVWTAADKTLVVTIPDFISYKDQKDDVILLTYKMTVDADAEIGGDGNTNSAKVIFSNNPNETTTNDSEPTISKTFVLGYELNKVFKSGEKEVDDPAHPGQKIKEPVYESLEGSKWKLEVEDKETAGRWITVYVPAQGNAAAVTKEGVTFTDSDPKFSWSGLDKGNYRLTEIEAPEGYTLLDASILFTINAEGQIVSGVGSLRSLSASVTSDPKTSVIANSAVLATGIVSMQIENTTFSVLPGTGGMGLVAIAAGAACLLAIALFPKRKKDE